MAVIAFTWNGLPFDISGDSPRVVGGPERYLRLPEKELAKDKSATSQLVSFEPRRLGLSYRICPL